jgi:hypothetical protein
MWNRSNVLSGLSFEYGVLPLSGLMVSYVC